MNEANPNCQICLKNDNYLIKNTCCDTVKYCLPCMIQIETNANISEIIGVNVNEQNICKTKISKCPNCKKRLKYEQHYIENPYVKPLEQLHTLILSHNLNVLHYIYNKIVCKNIASVGYYIGGMKETELKKSEKKQIVLATFSMASEALDIPSLNAEFLITPKTDIVQSVGRILRAKHAFSEPIIYDIKDNHDIFQKQWAKRKAYYTKQNYNIVECDSYNYQKDISKWRTTNKSIATKKVEQVKNCKTSSCSSSDKSIADDTEDEDDEIEDLDEEVTTKRSGICLLKFKK